MNITYPQTEVCRSRRTARARIALLAACLAVGSGTLSRVAAHPSTHGAKPSLRRPVKIAPHSDKNGTLTAFRKMEVADVAASHRTVNQDDFADSRTYAPIFGSQVPDARVLFPNPFVALTQEPDLPGLSISHDAPRTPWNGNKTPEQYRRDAGERITKLQRGWIDYEASFRLIAALLGADNVPYPTVPTLQFQTENELGSAHELYPGQPAYSSDAPGGVFLQGGITSRDIVPTSVVMQRTQVVNFTTDRMAQAHLGYLYDVPDFDLHDEPHEKYIYAWNAGYAASHEYTKRAASSNTSHLRGAYWRMAALAHHNAYSSAYHTRR